MGCGSETQSFISDPFSYAERDVWRPIGGAVENVVNNPLPVIETIALTVAGVPPPVSAAIVTAANGGSMEDIGKAALSSYVGGEVAQQVGPPVSLATGSDVVGRIAASASGAAAGAAIRGTDVGTAALSGAVGSGLSQAYQGLTTQSPAPVSTIDLSGVSPVASATPTIEQLYQSVLGRAPDPAAQAERPGAAYTPTQLAAADTGTMTDVSAPTTGVIDQTRPRVETFGTGQPDLSTEITGVGSDIPDEQIANVADINKSSAGLWDKIRNIGAIFSSGTSDPSSPYYALFGTGARGGDPQSGFSIFARDYPEQATIWLNNLVQQVQNDETLSPDQKQQIINAAADLRTPLEVRTETVATTKPIPSETQAVPGGPGGGGGGGETPAKTPTDYDTKMLDFLSTGKTTTGSTPGVTKADISMTTPTTRVPGFGIADLGTLGARQPGAPWITGEYGPRIPGTTTDRTSGAGGGYGGGEGTGAGEGRGPGIGPGEGPGEGGVGGDTGGITVGPGGPGMGEPTETVTPKTDYPIERFPITSTPSGVTRLFTPYVTDLAGLAPIERRKKTELTEEEGEPVGRWGSETLRGLLGI